MKEFKGTPGPWSIDDFGWLKGHTSISAPDHGSIVQVVGEMDWDGSEKEKVMENYVYKQWLEKNEELQRNIHLISSAPELLAALQWALPLAEVAMDDHRVERIRLGHTDIKGTYKNGVTYSGIFQEEVDQIERARFAIKKALGEI